MALPWSGQIAVSDINVELGRAWNHWFDINGAAERNAQKPSGPISFYDFYGKSSIIREPASGEAYNLASPFTAWEASGAGWVSIYWYSNSKAYDGRPGSGTTVLTVGTWTYYRGSQHYFSGSSAYHALYRMGKY